MGRAWANDSETGLGTSAGLRSDFPNLPVQTLKKATQKVLARLRKAGCSIEDHNDSSQRGRPSRIARVSDLSRAYPDLQ